MDQNSKQSNSNNSRHVAHMMNYTPEELKNNQINIMPMPRPIAAQEQTDKPLTRPKIAGKSSELTNHDSK